MPIFVYSYPPTGCSRHHIAIVSKSAFFKPSSFFFFIFLFFFLFFCNRFPLNVVCVFGKSSSIDHRLYPATRLPGAFWPDRPCVAQIVVEYWCNCKPTRRGLKTTVILLKASNHQNVDSEWSKSDFTRTNGDSKCL